ncbi:uncharacterized protein LOC131317366 [Rhododendron vialii]|uniref:uncharacterized protein LOC131317366 n=1 Tax=Rhododendron vialii TaxID=182163 RepID=UPI002660235F|nr:uncharacterized protein LOC131317366 [Rhododendron vialii]
MTILECVQKFQSLSHFAPELVAMKERKCRRFENGLHNTVRRMVMVQRKMKFSKVVECSFGSQGRKRQRKPSQQPPNQSNLGVPSSSGIRGAPSRPPIVCYRGGSASESGSVQQSGAGRGVGQQSFKGTQRQQPHFCQTSSVQSSGVDRGASLSAPSQGSGQGGGFVQGHASHSFIAVSFVCALELDTENLDSPLFVETPLGGKSSLSRIYKGCELVICNHRFVFDFIILDMSGFDLILGMDMLNH